MNIKIPKVIIDEKSPLFNDKLNSGFFDVHNIMYKQKNKIHNTWYFAFL